jgi:hypothetical protein
MRFAYTTLLLVISFHGISQQYRKHGTFVFGLITNSTITVGADRRETQVSFSSKNGKQVKSQTYSTAKYKKIGVVNTIGYAVAGFRDKNTDVYLKSVLSQKLSLSGHVRYLKREVQKTLQTSMTEQIKSNFDFWKNECNNRQILSLLIFGFEKQKPVIYELAYTTEFIGKDVRVKATDTSYRTNYAIVTIGEELPSEVYHKSLQNWRREAPPTFIKNLIVNASKVSQTIGPPVDVLELNPTSPAKWYSFQK